MGQHLVATGELRGTATGGVIGKAPGRAGNPCLHSGACFFYWAIYSLINNQVKTPPIDIGIMICYNIDMGQDSVTVLKAQLEEHRLREAQVAHQRLLQDNAAKVQAMREE